MSRWAWGELKNGGIRICRCGEVTLEDEMHACTLGEEKMSDGNEGLKHLTSVEDTKANMDTGRMGYRIMQGVIEEGGTMEEAIIILTSFFTGMFVGASQASKDKDEETPSS